MSDEPERPSQPPASADSPTTEGDSVAVPPPPDAAAPAPPAAVASELETPRSEPPAARTRDESGDAPGEAPRPDAAAQAVAAAEEVAASSAAPASDAAPEPPPLLPKQAWGAPLVRIDALWTRFEMGLATLVLLLEIAALSVWVALKGLSTGWDGTNRAGLAFRAIMGATVLGSIAWAALRKQPERTRSGVTAVAVLLGFLGARLWANTGATWSSNLLNWYQQGSSLTLFGGLRGVGTRLTMLLTLLGGSLATAAGKHITIDLVTRFLKPKVRVGVVVFGWLATSVICFSASWGFLDHIAIEDFGATKDATAAAKVSKISEDLGQDLFIARKQLGLDFKTLPHVLQGEPYSDWLEASEWNAWLEGSGMAERYGADKVEELKMAAGQKRAPIVVVPGKGEPRGELIHAANLIFPIGLFIIAVRFLLLALLTLSGHRSVDPEGHMELGIKKRVDADGNPLEAA